MNKKQKIMRKSIYLLIICAAFLFTGCSDKDQMTNFIPTQVPQQEENSSGDVEEGTEADTDTEGDSQTQEEGTTTDEVPIGPTVTKFVKLDEYGGYLNVRSKPSTDGDVLGFLVHAEEAEVIEVVDGWASIVYNDKVCYVNASFLVEERPAYLTPPPPTPTPIVTPTTAPASETAPPEI